MASDANATEGRVFRNGDEIAYFILELIAKKAAQETELARPRSQRVVRSLELQSKPITEEDRQRILECTRLGLLDRWFDRTFTIAKASELFDED